MKFSVLLGLLLMLPASGFAAVPGKATAAPNTFIITADEWAQPRSGAEIASLPPVRAAVQDWMQHPGYHLIILHSGDETGSLWASELRDWLVSLGIPSQAIGLRIGGQDDGSMILSVEP